MQMSLYSYYCYSIKIISDLQSLLRAQFLNETTVNLFKSKEVPLWWKLSTIRLMHASGGSFVCINGLGHFTAFKIAPFNKA